MDEPDLSPAPESGSAAPPAPERGGRRLAAVAVVAILVIVGLAVAVAFLAPPSSEAPIQSTHYAITPAGIVQAAADQNQAGYLIESSGIGGDQKPSWIVMGNPAGSTANLSSYFFSSLTGASGFYNQTVAVAKGSPGYQEISSDLSSFQQFGRCYSYGEDVDGIAVDNSICYKGNVVLQIHLVSGVDLPTLESDMISLMGTMYAVTQ